MSNCAHGVAARVRARGDVVKGAGRVRVQPRVQETKRGLSSRDKVAVDEGDNASEDGASTAGAVDSPGLACVDDLDVHSNGCDILICDVSTDARACNCQRHAHRVTPSARVELARVGRA